MTESNHTQYKPTVLIVDDDATIRLLMKDSLSEEPYIVDEISNGADALRYITENKPDLVLLDVNMPVMDGFEVCSEIRERFNETEISIVMVTGLDDSASIEKAYSKGATDFISKPINWNTFPYRIQYLLKASSAIKKVKQRELYLRHMEKISSIITQNKSKDIILKDVMNAMLDMFSADRAFIIKPKSAKNEYLIIEFEALSEQTASLKYTPNTVITEITKDATIESNEGSSTIATYFDQINPPSYDKTLTATMFKATPLINHKNWILVIQQCKPQTKWTELQKKIFNRISLRLTSVLSRYLIQEELHQNEKLLKQIQKIGHLGNWNWDAATNDLIWSEEIYRIYGQNSKFYTPNFNDFFKIAFEEDSQRLNQFKLIVDKTIDSYQINHQIHTANNDVRWVSEHCIGIFDKNGSLTEVNGVIQDINEAYIKKEQEIHNNKMDAIGQLTSGIAHDFGNFMTVAGGNIKLLKESIFNLENIDASTKELIDDTHSAIQDGIELTKQLLAFSRKKSIEPKYVSIEKTINKFKKLFKNTLGKNIELLTDVQNNLPDILVDPTQFESSLVNIIINARNAMSEGGKLSINAKIMDTTRPREIIRNADNKLGKQCICVYIKDNGIGMTNEVIDRSIEPFYTTHQHHGTGLGLSMVYGFITQSSGELVIHSQPKKGTTIYMQFPINNIEVIEQTSINQQDLLSSKQATILIVDDQDKVRQFAVRCLLQPGINILEAENAAAARHLLTAHDIDLLFTDILMPGDMNGHELAEWTNNHFPDIKILLTTAMENEPNSKQPIRNYNFKLLPKPYSKQELTDNINRYI